MKQLSKQEQLQQLYAPYTNCFKCPLGGLGRKNVVFGAGNPDSPILFIGEAPGAQEDEQGQPFVGRAGTLFYQTIKTVAFDPAKIYVTNIVKCRPPKNRTPTPLEISACTKLLLFQQIKIIAPRVICTLGKVATEAIIGQIKSMHTVSGTYITTQSYIVVPTFHPSYIMRTPSKMSSFKRDLTIAHYLTYKK